MNLTDAKIRSAKSGERTYKLADGGGLVLLVHQNGSKYWRFNYRFGEKSRTLSLGVYPSLTLSQARGKRDEARTLLRQNLDPCAQRKQERLLAEYQDRNTFQLIAEEWLDCQRARWTARHENRSRARLENHVFRFIGNRAVADIKPLEILAILRRLEEEKLTDTPRRILGLIRGVFAYAIATGRCEFNPALQLAGTLLPHRVEHYPTLLPEEVGQFLKGLKQVETTEQNRLAVRLLMHTALRTGEMRQAQWKHVDAQ